MGINFSLVLGIMLFFKAWLTATMVLLILVACGAIAFTVVDDIQNKRHFLKVALLPLIALDSLIAGLILLYFEVWFWGFISLSLVIVFALVNTLISLGFAAIEVIGRSKQTKSQL